MERRNMLAEDERAVYLLVVTGALKMYPPKRQRERNSSRQNATPSDQPVRRPTQVRALFYESLSNEIGKENLSQAENIARQLGRTKEYPPTPKPILTRWRTPQPHCKTIANAKSRKDARASVWHKCSVVVPQPVAANKNSQQ